MEKKKKRNKINRRRVKWPIFVLIPQALWFLFFNSKCESFCSVIVGREIILFLCVETNPLHPFWKKKSVLWFTYNYPCCCSVTKACPTLYDPMDCSRPGFPVLHYLPEFAQTHVHWIGGAIQPSHPLLSLFLLPSIFPCISIFSNELVLCIRWPKYWSFSFSFSISLSNEYSGMISFRIDWFDLLAVQGTLKSLLQHHSSKAVSSSMLLLSCLQSSHVFNIHSNFLVKPSEVEDTFSDRIMKFYNDLEKCILT